ncbi:MAG TPA: MraY family glycosyltransferase [Candidatus Acidoferrum sp.]|nr:MraY family glycosyltransferase [Candidatus Acidoferrum sp.]
MLPQIQQHLPPVSALVMTLVGFCLSMAIIPFILLKFASRMSHRRELHQTHKMPVPRLGGIPLGITFIVASVVAYFWIPGGPTPESARIGITVTTLLMLGLGLWDDFSALGARKKLIGQILIALLAFAWGMRIETFKNPLTSHVYQFGFGFSILATVLWLVAMTNLINLIDGIDGLAGGISLMLMLLLAYVGGAQHPFLCGIAMAIGGALLGFLRYNFPPAKIYLGDGGAYMLGFLIGALSLQNSNKGSIAAALIAPVFALGLPILDVALSILRRGLQGLPIFRPDRRHIHHRLLHAGFSRQRAVLTLYAISIVLLGIALIAFWSEGRLTPILFGCAFLLLLVITPSLGLIRNWLTVGNVLGNSFEMRREVQYALLLRTCLEREAERCESVEELCGELQTMARKLGFAELRLDAADGLRHWTAADIPEGELIEAKHELHVEGKVVHLTLKASLLVMNERKFDVLSELVAEAWLQASRRWSKSRNLPFAFEKKPDKAPALPDAGTVGSVG